MKNSGLLYTLIAAAFFIIPQTAFADVNVSVSGNDATSNVSVNSQTDGQSTTCVNGQCTSTGGGSHSTVCVNGKCTTSDNGNVDVQSDDGHSQVHINTNTSPATPSNTLEPTNKPSITPDPTIMQMRKDLNNKVKQQADAVKDHVQKQENAIQKFFHQQMDSLNHLWKNWFK